MIRSRDFCTLARRMLDEKWGYILNAYGQFWTEKDQANTTDSMARQYGRQWIGRRVIDCSGIGYLIFTLLGQKMAHGSNSMWDSWVNDRCELKNGKRADGKEMWPGDPVFRKEQRESGTWRRHHVGYYMGNGVVIEARGTQYGVVSNENGGKGRGLTGWHETARWNNMDYGNGGGAMETLKRGDSGADVRQLQQALNEWGCVLTVDGKFGAKTEAAVCQWQAKMGLNVTGICDQAMWAGLTQEPEDVIDLKLSRTAARELMDQLKAAGIR